MECDIHKTLVQNHLCRKMVGGQCHSGLALFPVTFSPGGQLLQGDPAVAESELVYVVEDARGRQETLKPSEFLKRAGLAASGSKAAGKP